MKNENNSKIDVFYKCLVDELQLMRTALMNEMKYSSAQTQALYQGLTAEKAASSAALTQEIRYSYKQNQNIYEGLAAMVKNDIAQKINAISDKMEALEQLSAIINDLSELKYNYAQLQTVYESLANVVNGEMAPKLAEVATKDETKAIVDESLAVHTQTLLDNAPEAIDYDRISEEVGDKLLELLADMKAAAEEEEIVDYDRIAGDTATKVMESLPYPEPVDYNQIEESIHRAVSDAVSDAVNLDAIAEAVASTVSAETIAEAVVDKIVMPTAPEFDYDKLAELVAAKMAAPEVDYDKLADIVVEKIAAKGISADVVLDEQGISKIADAVADKVGVAEPIDYDRLGAATAAAQPAPAVEESYATPMPVEVTVDYDKVALIVEEKLAAVCENMERVVTLDDEGIEKIVGGITEELKNNTFVCPFEGTQPAAPAVAEEAPVEEVVEEAPAEEPVEEVAEEPAPVEEPVEEPAPAEEELSVSDADPVLEEDGEGQLIDAETGLVVRLKRSFTAKMKQSDERIKAYYSDIKNALTSYKRINSNVSWHGDRFNYGRDTIAKIGINGKTLCFYLALDPNDTELKTTVYHQKDVGAQKAYESTPFMVKVKSDAAAKKALRLVGILAEKIGAVPDEDFVEVDYVKEFAYASTKRLYEEGDIKATKEKEVDFNF